MKPPNSHRPGAGGGAGGGQGRGPDRGPRPPQGPGKGQGGNRQGFGPRQDQNRPRQDFQHHQGHHGGPRPQRVPEAPRGTVWLYGLHAVAAALANPSRRLRRLMLTEEAEAELAQRLAPPWPLPTERTERGRIDQLLGRDTVHQGAALLADPLPQPSLAQLLERPGPIVVLDQVTDPRNVGAICGQRRRSAPRG